MIRTRPATAVAAALAAGVVAAVAFVGLYGVSPGIRFEMDRDVPAGLSGVL